MSTGHPFVQSPFLKVIVTGVVAGALLIPLALVGGLVGERVGRRDEVTREVSAMWGRRQTTGAIVLTVPYDETRRVANGVETIVREAHFLPDVLAIDAEVVPEVRARSIFKVVVYRARLTFTGRFGRPDLARAGASPALVHWDRARVSIGVSDVRGLSAVSPLTFGDSRVELEPGGDQGPLMSGGLRAATPLGAVMAAGPQAAADQGGIRFAASLTLAGTEALAFVPAGTATDVTLRSTWPDAGFSGAFLPESRQVTGAGVTAHWQVAHFARGYPQAWVEGATDGDDHKRRVAESEFALGLVQTVDQYRQAERAVKYGVLFILLTFVVFFLWEVLAALRLHPVQYSWWGARSWCSTCCCCRSPSTCRSGRRMPSRPRPSRCWWRVMRRPSCGPACAGPRWWAGGSRRCTGCCSSSCNSRTSPCSSGRSWCSSRWRA